MDQVIQADSPPRCQVVVAEYHAFIGATVRFLNEVRERQMRWRWGAQSPVFNGVGWLQGLWASRRTVSGRHVLFSSFALMLVIFLCSVCWFLLASLLSCMAMRGQEELL